MTVNAAEQIQRIQALSELVSRASLAGALGMQYGGARDIYQALGYPLTLTYNDLLSRYTRQDIARAVINKPVAATWRGGFWIQESGEDRETELEKAWAELARTLKLRSKFSRVDKLCGLGKYAVLLLGFDDVTDGSKWGQPVTTGGRRRLLYVTPLGQDNATVNAWVKDSRNERYGLPEKYNCTITREDSRAIENTTLVVHWTRIIHIADELLESDIVGSSRLESVFNRLVDIEKLVGGSAEMFWRGARPGYVLTGQPDFQITTELLDKLKEQIDEYEHNLRRMLTTQGIDANALQMQVADPQSHVDVALQMISAVTGIPKRILVGSERGELASTQDVEAWKEEVQARREEFAEPMIIIPFVERNIEYGVLPKPSTGVWSVEWEDLWSPSDEQKAKVGQLRADALSKYINALGAEAVLPPDDFLRYGMGLSDEDIELIRENRGAQLAEEEATARIIEERSGMAKEQPTEEGGK